MVFRRRRASRRDAVNVTEPATLASVSTAATGVVALLDAGEVPDHNYRVVVDTVRSKGSRARTVAVGAATKHADHSIVATHLAVSAVASGLRVVLVDGALRGSRLAPLFDRPDTPGLTDVVSQRTTLGDALKPPVDGRDLLLLPAGQPATQPDRMLGDPALATLMSHLAGAADLVVVDTDPTNLRGWADLLDGALLVAPERAKAHTTALTDAFVFGVVRTHDRSPETGDTALPHPEEIGAEILPAEPGAAEAPVAGSEVGPPRDEAEPLDEEAAHDQPEPDDQPEPHDEAAAHDEPAVEDMEQDVEPPGAAPAQVGAGRAPAGGLTPTTVRTVGEIMADLAARRREQDQSGAAGAATWRSRPRDRRHRTGAPVQTSTGAGSAREPEPEDPGARTELFTWDEGASVFDFDDPDDAAPDRGADETGADTGTETASAGPAEDEQDSGIADHDIDVATASEILFLPDDEGA